MDLAGKPGLQILRLDLDIANVEEREERKSFVKWSEWTQTEEKNYTKPRSRQTL